MLISSLQETCPIIREKIFSVLLCFLFASGLFFSSDGGDLTRGYWNRGIHYLVNRESAREAAARIDKHVSRGEYEAYIWIRENTNLDAIFLVDNNVFGEYMCVFPALAERTIYNTDIEADYDDYCSFFTQGNDATGLLSQVNYVVIHKDIHNEEIMDEILPLPIYANDEVVVFSVSDDEYMCRKG